MLVLVLVWCGFVSCVKCRWVVVGLLVCVWLYLDDRFERIFVLLCLLIYLVCSGVSFVFRLMCMFGLE